MVTILIYHMNVKSFLKEYTLRRRKGVYAKRIFYVRGYENVLNIKKGNLWVNKFKNRSISAWSQLQKGSPS